MSKWFKKEKKRILSLILMAVILVSQNQAVISHAQENILQEQVTENDAAEVSEVQDSGNIIQYVAVEKAYMDASGIQNIVVGMEKSTKKYTQAHLVIENQTTGETHSVEAKQIDETSVLFQLQVDLDTQEGVYQVSEIILHSGEDECYLLHELGIAAKFGVGEYIETSPDAVTVEEKDADLSVLLLMWKTGNSRQRRIFFLPWSMPKMRYRKTGSLRRKRTSLLYWIPGMMIRMRERRRMDWVKRI